MKYFNRLVDWLEQHGLWGVLITLMVVTIISVTYLYEKRYEARTSATEYGYYSRLEFPLIDFRHRFSFDPEEVSDDIVIVTITETALDRYQDSFGRWPWPRKVMGQVVKFLGQADSVMLDIGFMEPSGKEVYPDEAEKMKNLLNAAVQLQGTSPKNAEKYFDAVNRKLKNLSQSGDRALGRSLRNNGHAVTASWFVDISGGKLPEEKTLKIKNMMNKFGYKGKGEWESLPLLSYVTPPIEPVIKNSYGLSHISFTPDPDGPARRFHPFIGLNKSKQIDFKPEKPFLPILGLIGYLEESDLDPGEASFKVGEEMIKIGDRKVPLDRKGNALVRYEGGLMPRGSKFSAFKEVPIEQIIGQLMGQEVENAPGPEFFKGKKVFIGSTASGAHDLRATPFSAQEAGVAIHANILDMFLQNEFLHPIETDDTIINVILWGVAVGLITTLLSPLMALILTVLLTCLFLIMGIGLFNQGYIINLSAPLLTSYLTYALVTVYNLTFEQRKRRQVRNAFESYLASSVMEEVLKDPDQLELGGERREITLMFADVSGFTSFSEGRTATEVASVIGKVMTALTDCVFRYEGVLDKYIGDELVAEFGIVPGEPPDHAKRAIKAATDMIDRLEELQEEWRREGKEVLDLRVGLHTGYAATGNMGSEMLFDYTAIGDNVNLGSRLEGANKKYNTRTMISEATYEKAPEFVEVRELDRIIVKGRKEPVTVYELLGRKGQVDEDVLELRDRFEEGLSLYREQKWDRAIEQFKSIQQDYPKDGPTPVFMERSKEYREDPPDEDWDGAYRATSK